MTSLQSQISLLQSELDRAKERAQYAEVDKFIAQQTAQAASDSLNASLKLNDSLRSLKSVSANPISSTDIDNTRLTNRSSVKSSQSKKSTTSR